MQPLESGAGGGERSANETRAAAQAHADKLSKTAGADRAHVSESWSETQQSWRDHLAKMDENLRGAKTAIDVEEAENRAEDAAIQTHISESAQARSSPRANHFTALCPHAERARIDVGWVKVGRLGQCSGNDPGAWRSAA